MRTDFVLSLEGPNFTLAPSRTSKPQLILRVQGLSRTVVRVVIDEPLSREELDESVEVFEARMNLSRGEMVVETRWDEDDEDAEEELDQKILSLPEGTYRVTVHATLAGPLAPGKLEKETLKSYFRRTRPDTPAPSWLQPDEESEEFWVGMIVHLETAEGLTPVSRPQPIKPGKNVRKPERCPLGIRSIEPEGWERYVQTDLYYIHRIPGLVASMKPQSVRGGAVQIPVKEMILPYWIAWVCGETHPWVKVTCDPAFRPEWPGFKQGIKATEVDSGWQIDIEGSNARWSQFRHLRQVASILEGLPDGSQIELACADNEAESKAGFHRYVGTATGGTWSIERTYPAMDAATLRDMLDLVRQAETGLVVHARNEAEADRLVRSMRTQDFLLRESPPKRKGLAFELPKDKPELMPFLIARAFLARYPNTLPAIDRDDDLGDWDEMMDKIAQAGARHATGELVFEGRFADFKRTNIGELEQANHSHIEECDQWLSSRGFQLLGDLNCTQTFRTTFRGYALPESPIYAAIIENGYGSARLDLYTRFPNGFSLTTSEARVPKVKFSTDRRLKSHRSEVPGGFEPLWEAHAERLAELTQRHGIPHPVGDLRDFAAELDDFFVRLHGPAKESAAKA